MDQNTKNIQNLTENKSTPEVASEALPKVRGKRSGLLVPQNEKRTKTTPKKVKQSIKLDPVNPSDFLNYTFLHSCEHCSHWNSQNGLCSLGYKNDVHRLEANLKSYELCGKMALCRFLEID